MIIIGITGSIGAGKGTVVEHLIEKRGFSHFSARAFLAEEIERRGLVANRDVLTQISNELRTLHGPSYIVESLYKRAKEKGENCIIESIRTLGEIEALRLAGDFHLLAVHADLPIRYQRIIIRNNITDQISFDTFVMQDEREAASTDTHKQNINACIKQADFILMNNGTLEELESQIEEILVKLHL